MTAADSVLHYVNMPRRRQASLQWRNVSGGLSGEERKRLEDLVGEGPPHAPVSSGGVIKPVVAEADGNQTRHATASEMLTRPSRSYRH